MVDPESLWSFPLHPFNYMFLKKYIPLTEDVVVLDTVASA